MPGESPLILIAAQYDLWREAEADLAAAAEFVIDAGVELYDGALLTTDAWAQVTIREWRTPLLSGPAGFLREAVDGALQRRARTADIPVPAAAPAPRGFARSDLEKVGTSMPPDAAMLVVAAQTSREADFVACFKHSRRLVARTVPVDAAGRYQAVGAVLHELMAALHG